jgi:uncharacterized damage-inducible protein DinB
MEAATMDPRYPIGKYHRVKDATPETRRRAIAEIAVTPARLRAAVVDLREEQLEAPYREGGWSVRQLVHHVADSHMNAYVRFKLALAETTPTIKPYEEKDWAEFVDAKTLPVAVSLNLLDALHERWVVFLSELKQEDFARTFVHPEHGAQTVEWMLFLYAWHGQHHVAHVTELRKRKGW